MVGQIIKISAYMPRLRRVVMSRCLGWILSETSGPILTSLPVALDPRLVPITSSWCIVTSFDRILALI